MDLTWYDRSDVMTGVVTELGSLLRHVRDRPDRVVGRVSRSRLSTSSRPLLPCIFLVVGYRVNMFEQGLGEHCFRGGGISHLFRRSKGGSVGASRTGWCCLASHSLEPTKTSQATPGVSVARLVPWVISQLTSRGGAGSDSSGI